MTNKTYILYWYDKEMKCTNRTTFEARNNKVAINIANHFVDYYDMEFPHLYEEVDEWHSNLLPLGWES